jgi:hypothetical protein
VIPGACLHQRAFYRLLRTLSRVQNSSLAILGRL